MVTDKKKDSRKTPGKQGAQDSAPEPNKINASTPYDFNGKNLTPYGGLLPVVTMLEKLGFQPLVEQTLTTKRIPRAMDWYRFVLGIVLGLYIGFPRLNQLRFIARDPILTGILRVTKLPVQSTFWRFVNAWHRNVARQILNVMRIMRERVWEAANVKLDVVTIDTDTIWREVVLWVQTEVFQPLPSVVIFVSAFVGAGKGRVADPEATARAQVLRERGAGLARLRQ